MTFVERARSTLESAKATGENPTSQRALEALIEEAIKLVDEKPPAAIVPDEKAVEELISRMCLTYRHDYGLLDESERSGLRLTMRQIFQHDVLPFAQRLASGS